LTRLSKALNRGGLSLPSTKPSESMYTGLRVARVLST
jgi:hypothetical protein